MVPKTYSGIVEQAISFENYMKLANNHANNQ